MRTGRRTLPPRDRISAGRHRARATSSPGSRLSHAKPPRQRITRTPQQLQFGEPPTFAGIALGGARLVGRRRATDGGGDVTIPQPQAVAAADRRRAVGESGPVQGGEKEIARAVAGEDAAGAIAAVSRRSQAENQDAGGRVTETGDGPAPVFLVAIGSPFGSARLLRAIRPGAGSGDRM